MKKGVLNYSVTYIENGSEKNEIICFTKQFAIKQYIDLIYSNKDIALLSVWEHYKSPGRPSENITGKINKFLAI